MLSVYCFGSNPGRLPRIVQLLRTGMVAAVVGYCIDRRAEFCCWICRNSHHVVITHDNCSSWKRSCNSVVVTSDQVHSSTNFNVRSSSHNLRSGHFAMTGSVVILKLRKLRKIFWEYYIIIVNHYCISLLHWSTFYYVHCIPLYS